MIEVFTLVDITQTKIHRNNRPQGSSYSQHQWDFLRNKQRNWDTVLQLLGLRFQPMDIVSPTCLENQKSTDYSFGTIYDNRDDLKVWNCGCSYEHIVDSKLLTPDFDNIPIITGLEESVHITSPFFITNGNNCNILIINNRDKM